MASTPLSVADRYELGARLAVGGMAEVFRATSFGAHGFSKVVAIKRILPALLSDPSFERRFIAEAKLAVELAHANIAQILDFSRFGRSLYIVMEFVDGGDLQQVLQLGRDRHQPLPLDVAMHIAIELLRGLTFAHERGVVHRDVSPSNVLLSRAGEVKIADFGIARAAGVDLAHNVRIMGKWRYMSPEQTRGEELDARSDVFSAAVVLHEVFTGSRLFPGADAESIVASIRGGGLAPISTLRVDLPPELDAPIAAALALDPAARSDGKTLLDAVTEICYGRSIPAMPHGLSRYLASLLPARRPDEAVGAAPPARLLDQILRSEGTSATARHTKSRMTGRALGPPVMAAEDVVDEGGFPDEPSRTGFTLLRGAPDADGVTRWELEDATGTLTEVALDPAGLDGPDTGLLTGALTVRRAGPGPVAARAASAPPPPSAGRARWVIGPLLAALGGAGLAFGGRAAGWWALPGDAASSGAARDAALRVAPALAPAPAIAPPLAAAPPPPLDAGVPPPIDAAPDPARRPPRDRHRPTPSEPKAARGTIDLFCDPWADVYFNGRKIATAPKRSIELPVGRHRLTLRNPVQGRSTTIVVEVPSSKPIKVTLPPAKPR
jgi:serine/threonine-protein kinase